jgi:cytochrome c5
MKVLMEAIIFSSLTVAVSAAAALQQTAKPASTVQSPTPSSSHQKTGEEVFNNNCLRCHTPPMAISPRITGTIIMHMRTRARLSREDEKLLLKYLAP